MTPLDEIIMKARRRFVAAADEVECQDATFGVDPHLWQPLPAPPQETTP